MVQVLDILDFDMNRPLNFGFEIITSLPTASAALKGRCVTYNNLPYFCNGTTWIDLSTGTPVSSIELPEKTVFVSPTFSGTDPFYLDLDSAKTATSAGDYIVVFPGTYTAVDMTERHWYYHSGTRVIGTSAVYYDSNTSIRGNAVFDGDTQGAALKVWWGGSPVSGIHELEFSTVMQGQLVIDSWCGSVKATNVQDQILITGNAPTSETDDPAVYLDITTVRDLTVEFKNGFVYANIHTILGKMGFYLGNSTVEFKRMTGTYLVSGNNAVEVYGSTSYITKLKLIDGRLPESFDASGSYPVNVGDYCDVTLQHIWGINGHDAVVYLSGNVRNSHLLKVDTCVLIGTYAIHSAVSSQNCYCIGSSWGQNNVSGNITMMSETLNVGSIY